MSDLTVRSPSFPVADWDLPPRWLGGDAFRTQTFNALSMSFPVGERYFIDSVRAALPLAGAPGLAEDVRRFIAQESRHSHLHREFNVKLAAQGLPNLIEPICAWRIRTIAGLNVRHKLAIAAAYEHFTAALGDAVLAGRPWLEGAAEPVRALWMWHAAEECEHRAVVFDVYRHLGGGEMRRLAWFLYISLIFAVDLTLQVMANLWRSGAFLSLSTWRRGWRFLFGRGGVAGWMLPVWLAYLRPGFNPRDRGERAAAERWFAANRHWFSPGAASEP